MTKNRLHCPYHLQTVFICPVVLWFISTRFLPTVTDVLPVPVLTFLAPPLPLADCGMNCHKLCKDQVAFECKKNPRVTSAIDSPTLSSTPLTAANSEGGSDPQRWQKASLPKLKYCYLCGKQQQQNLLIHPLYSGKSMRVQGLKCRRNVKSHQ